MTLLGFIKKKEAASEENKAEEKRKSCCNRNYDVDSMTAAEEKKAAGATVKVLGSGCAKCNQLETAVREALRELEMDMEIEHVSDFSQIAAYGVMTTPALVVGGKVVSFGKVLKKEEAIQILKSTLA